MVQINLPKNSEVKKVTITKIRQGQKILEKLMFTDGTLQMEKIQE